MSSASTRRGTKSLRTSYLIWAFLGLLFVHRLYLRPDKGLSSMLALTMVVCMVAAIEDIGLLSWVGLVGVGVLFLVALLDLFEISGWVANYNHKLEAAPHKPS